LECSPRNLKLGKGLILQFNTTYCNQIYASIFVVRITGSTILHSLDSINRPFEHPSQTKLCYGAILEDINGQKLWKWLSSSLLNNTKHKKP